MGTSAQHAYPPSMNGRFIIGHDAYGHWVVCDRFGLTGGLFTDRDSALHFALAESNRAPNAVIFASDDNVLSLGPIFDSGFSREQMQRHA